MLQQLNSARTAGSRSTEPSSGAHHGRLVPGLSCLRALVGTFAFAAGLIGASPLAPAPCRSITVEPDPACVKLDPIHAEVGTSVRCPVRVETSEPVRVLGIRMEGDPGILALRSWSFGDGLARHIADHGEPPACDVIIYPNGAGMFSVMALSVPYSSAEYGEDWLVFEYEVTGKEQQSTCVFVQSDTDDYEAGALLRLSDLVSRAPKRCVAAFVSEAKPFRRGDVDGDGHVGLGDAVRTLRDLFSSQPGVRCQDAADVDDDGRLSVSDPIALINALFRGAGPIGETCELDGTVDSLLSCERSDC